MPGEIGLALEAANSGFDLTNKILTRLWGDQTSEGATREHEAQKYRDEFAQAMETGDVGAANAAHARLLTLLDEAIAKRIGA